jgi:hypothetical protein
MKTAVIGAHGVVGKAVSQHFIELGHQVIEIDTDTDATIENSLQDVQVIFVVILPLAAVHPLLERVVELANHGSLIVHGSSIETPSLQLDQQLIERKGLTVCHCHFHFRPEIPLSRTLFGQKISVSYRNDEGIWRNWIEEQFTPFKPEWHEMAPGVHDLVTENSQVPHMVESYVMAHVFAAVNRDSLLSALAVGGPPFRMLWRLVNRIAQAPDVSASILHNHPYTPNVISQMEAALAALMSELEAGDESVTARQIARVRSLTDKETVEKCDVVTAQLMKIDSDISTCHVEFHFPEQQNKPGLLIRVLREFEKRSISIMSDTSLTNADGSCTFRFGITEMNDEVQEAVAAVQSWQ